MPLPAVALVTLAVAWLVCAFAVRTLYSGEALPGTTLAEADLGGADEGQARDQVEALNPLTRSVAIAYGGRSFRIGAQDVGFRLDARRSADRALAAGRDGVLGVLSAPLALFGVGRDVDPVFAIDRTRLRRAVANIAHDVDTKPFDGALSIDPVTLEVDVEPPRDARLVDRSAIARAVDAALRRDPPRRVELRVVRRRAPSPQAAEAVAEDARAYLDGGGLQLTGAGEPINLPASEVAPLLAIEPQRGRAIRLGVDAAAVEQLVAGIARRRDRRPASARIRAEAAPVVLEEKGDASWRPRRATVSVGRARPGQAIEQDKAVRAIASAIRTDEHDAELPVRRLEPPVTTAAAKRVKRLIGTFTTRFACCEPRVKNIQLIAQAVDGTLVAPGAQFSLNRAAGERTKARGFVPAPFISDGKIVPSIGGGVSQFSTTVYNAAYFAGLRLDSHQPHSFFIERYPAGREATLDFASIDLTWTNDTQAPVLVRASATDTSVTVSLYGDNGGRRVSSRSGAREPVPERDFSITVTRTVRYPDGRVARQPFTTTYDKPPPPEEEPEENKDDE